MIKGNIDRPLLKNTHIKALFLAESNKKDWNFNNLKVVNINNKNIENFDSSDYELGICSNLNGINLPYLTHIIVTKSSCKDDIIQFIGRGQRINRKTNLKVLYIN